MSLECSECERDLRGGHDEGCSRYKLQICDCGHKDESHDEEGDCGNCGCVEFVLNKLKTRAEKARSKMSNETKLIGESDAEYDHEFDHWLTEKVREGRGAVLISETEGGDIGIFIGDSEESLGTGDTVFDAISSITQKEKARNNGK